MKKIGIMGGTFDPIHLGHLEMGRAAMQALKLNEVVYMPSGVPAYKLAKQRVSGKEDREEMTRLAIRDIPEFSFSGMELEREGNTYTADTVRIFHEEHPEDELFFIMGADSLDYMDLWVRPQEIFDHTAVIAMGREGFSKENTLEKAKFLENLFHGRVFIAEMKPVDVSSTEIRNRVREGLSVEGLVTEAVAQYISDHHLYQED